jgi:hypothetical protein
MKILNLITTVALATSTVLARSPSIRQPTPGSGADISMPDLSNLKLQESDIFMTKDMESITDSPALYARPNTNNSSSFVALGSRGKESTSDRFYLVDSGASTHLSTRLEDFISLKNLTFPLKMTGVGGVVDIFYTGTLKLDCNVHGEKRVVLLDNSVYCPSCNMNLISVAQFLREDELASVHFDRNGVTISEPSGIVTASLLKNDAGPGPGGLYLLDMWK